MRGGVWVIATMLTWWALSTKGLHAYQLVEVATLSASLATFVGAAVLVHGTVLFTTQRLQLWHADREARAARWATRVRKWDPTLRRVRVLIPRLVGLAVFAALWLGGIILEGGHPEQLLQVTGAMVVAAWVLGGLLMSDGIGVICELVGVIAGASVRSAGRAAHLADVCRRGRRLAWVGGGVSLAGGLLHVMSVLDTPELIGPGVAVALIGLLYGAFVAEIGFGAAVRWVQAAAPA